MNIITTKNFEIVGNLNTFEGKRDPYTNHTKAKKTGLRRGTP